MADEEATYLQQRVDTQSKWYGDHADRERVMFYTIKTAQIVATAIISIGSFFKYPSIISACLGVLIVAMESLLQLSQCHEYWLRHRSIQLRLDSERSLFKGLAGPYAAGEPFKILVQRVEALLSSDTEVWIKQEKMAQTQPEQNKQ
ncbi:MAG: DUF4231 domain-containing protein [Deltaproteobacteria bacterium]|nr:DUF4231 domain-containing protein [Deltaproteobacteria bacterium]